MPPKRSDESTEDWTHFELIGPSLPRVGHRSECLPASGLAGSLMGVGDVPTCVTEGHLRLVAGVVVPLARVLGPLDVDLHAVLLRLLVVGLPVSPVLSLLGEGFIGPHPSPDTPYLPDPDPVVGATEGERLLQVLNFPLVLYGD